MSLIDDCEQADLQADLEDLLDKDCAIKRPTKVNDGLGTYTETLTTIDTTTCSLSQPSASQLATYGEELGALALWQVKMPPKMKTVVRAQDTLSVDGRSLLVQRLLTPRSLEFLLILLASEVR